MALSISDQRKKGKGQGESSCILSFCLVICKTQAMFHKAGLTWIGLGLKRSRACWFHSIFQMIWLILLCDSPLVSDSMIQTGLMQTVVAQGAEGKTTPSARQTCWVLTPSRYVFLDWCLWAVLHQHFLGVISFSACSLFIIEGHVVSPDGFGNLLWNTMWQMAALNSHPSRKDVLGALSCVAHLVGDMKAVDHDRGPVWGQCI